MIYLQILSLLFIYFTKYIIINITYEYNKRKAIIRQKSPVASAKANPKIAYWNNWARNEGFLAVASIKLPNTNPIPTPAPATLNLLKIIEIL